MNLQQLEYLVKIAETKNFTKAAKEMNVTQPALSKSIAKLEEELDVELFIRDGRNAVFTEYGDKFLTYAKRALHEISQGVDQINTMKVPKESRIAISATQCISNHFIPFIISGFMGEHENIQFQFLNQKKTEIFEALKKEEIDFGFFDDKDPLILDKEITSIPIKKEEFVLIVPKNHRLSARKEISLREIQEEAYIVLSDGKSKDNIYENEIMKDFLQNAKKIPIQAQQAHMIGALVAANVGITIVPNTPMINESRVSIIKIMEDIGYKTIYIGWTTKEKMSYLAKQFLDYVVENSKKMDDI